MSKPKKPATTIKISGELLKKITETKPAGQPLTTYIRQAIERDLTREQVQKSAEAYMEFLANHPKENEWLKDWESSRLDHPTRNSRAKKH